MSKVRNVMIFSNGVIAVFDESGQQVPKLQNSWLDFQALRKLAEVIVKDKPNVEGSAYIPTSALTDYIRFYEKQRDNVQLAHAKSLRKAECVSCHRWFKNLNAHRKIKHSPPITDQPNNIGE